MSVRNPEAFLELIGDPDARHWARKFISLIRAKRSIATDEGAMLAWFSCAIETGRMVVEREQEKIIERYNRRTYEAGHPYTDADRGYDNWAFGRDYGLH